MENVVKAHLVSDPLIIAALAATGITSYLLWDEEGDIYAVFENSPEFEEALQNYQERKLKIDALTLAEEIQFLEAKTAEWRYLRSARTQL